MPIRTTTSLSLLAVLFTTACAGATASDVEGDETSPQLIVISPDRGTTNSADTVLVEGIVRDEESGIESVTISGVPATLHGDSTFSAEVALADGLNLLQVVATDRSGNQSQSTRAVLSGALVPADEVVKHAAQVYIGHDTLAAIGDTSEAILGGLDIDALLAEANPVLSRGSSACLNASVDLNEIQYDDLQVVLEPAVGGIRAVVTLTGIDLEARAFHDVACIPGSTAISIAADEAEVEAVLDLAVSGGKLVAHVDTSEARFDNLTVDVGILPSSVIEFVVGDLDEKLGDKLSDLMARELPPIVERNIEKLGTEHEVQIFENAFHVAVRPSVVEFDDDGGTLTLETHVASSRNSAPYLSTVKPLPPMLTDVGLSVVVADDALNQALSALWETGALNQELGLISESGADLGGGILDRVRLRAPLAPVIDADTDDGSLKLTIGDLLIELVKDGESNAVSQLAVSLQMDVSVYVDGGELRLHAGGEPTIYMDRLDVDGFLNDRDMEILVAFASNMLAGDLNKLLGEIPLPTYEGTSIANAAVTAVGGYLQIGADLVR